jgi:uncharacterized membrane protein YidH (DUF202 family)
MPAKKTRKTRKKHPGRARQPSRNSISRKIEKLDEKIQELKLEEERTLFLKEQTVLAKERTILSFMRTGLGFITAGFAIIAAAGILETFMRVHPAMPFVIGTALVIVGFLEIIESFRRLRIYRQKMKDITGKLGDDDV